VKLADDPAAMLWAAVVITASTVPLGDSTFNCAVTPCDAVPELTTEVVTWTVAAAAVGDGVVTYVAYWSM
jgi:hypothetical protein